LPEGIVYGVYNRGRVESRHSAADSDRRRDRTRRWLEESVGPAAGQRDTAAIWLAVVAGDGRARRVVRSPLLGTRFAMQPAAGAVRFAEHPRPERRQGSERQQQAQTHSPSAPHHPKVRCLAQHPLWQTTIPRASCPSSIRAAPAIHMEKRESPVQPIPPKLSCRPSTSIAHCCHGLSQRDHCSYGWLPPSTGGD